LQVIAVNPEQMLIATENNIERPQGSFGGYDLTGKK
jgi:hypothetical protein